MYEGLRVIDADSHKMENPVVFFDYLEAPYRERLFSRTDRWGQQRLVIRDFNPATGRADLERVFPQPDGPGKRAYNDYIADDCRGYAKRVFPVGYLSLADVGEAVREMHRVVETLGMIGVHV